MTTSQLSSQSSKQCDVLGINFGALTQDATHARECTALLDEFTTGQCTRREFIHRNCVLSMRYLDSYKYVPIPDVPHSLNELRKEQASPTWFKNTMVDRTAVIKNVMDRPEVKEYFDALSDSEGANVSNARWLEHLLKVFKACSSRTDFDKVLIVYNTFPKFIRNIWHRKDYAFL